MAKTLKTPASGKQLLQLQKNFIQICLDFGLTQEEADLMNKQSYLLREAVREITGRRRLIAKKVRLSELAQTGCVRTGFKKKVYAGSAEPKKNARPRQKKIR